jgi:hypothetical protein
MQRFVSRRCGPATLVWFEYHSLTRLQYPMLCIIVLQSETFSIPQILRSIGYKSNGLASRFIRPLPGQSIDSPSVYVGCRLITTCPNSLCGRLASMVNKG